MAHHRIIIELTARKGPGDFFEYKNHTSSGHQRTPKIKAAHGKGRPNEKDGVEWKCKVNGKPACRFAVHFQGPWPLDKGRYVSDDTGTITANFFAGGPTGYFKYFVAVDDGKRIWTDDPDMIVW